MNAFRTLGLGVFALALAAGCGQPAASPSKPAPAPHHDDDHEHPPPPHGGALIELGRYHGEFTVDHEKKQATVYILDGKVVKAVPVKAEQLKLVIKEPAFEVDLVPLPQEGDPAGKSSRFTATHDHFGKVQEFEGTVRGVLDGKPAEGDFKEEDHAHEKKKG